MASRSRDLARLDFFRALPLLATLHSVSRASGEPREIQDISIPISSLRHHRRQWVESPLFKRKKSWLTGPRHAMMLQLEVTAVPA